MIVVKQLRQLSENICIMRQDCQGVNLHKKNSRIFVHYANGGMLEFMLEYTCKLNE